ncbi:hypothetical protein ACFC6U_41105, partial [Kitasatospora purpeofusca]|uniref:hypothetical protein n=1 Tax=Kitasatospora purpeofusca TaxID=67352 RepID=UPI0035E1750C
MPAAWVTTGTRAWQGAVPTVAAEAQAGPERPVRAGRWSLLISSWSSVAAHGAPGKLAVFVSAVLTGELLAH